MSKESRLMRNTAIIAVGNICTKCISFFMLPLYTSLLTTEEYGTADLIATYTSLIVIVLTLQFEQGVFRFLIEARSDSLKQKKYITTTLYAVVVINIIFLIVGYPFLQILKYEYTIYLLVNIVVNVVSSVILQIPRGLGSNTIYAIGSFIYGSLNVILNVLFIAVFKMGIDGLLMAGILGRFFSVVYIVIKAKLWRYLGIKEFDKNCFNELSKYSLPLIPYTMCWWIVNASDRVMISIFLGAAANGIYAAAYKFPSLFSMICNIFQLSWAESAAENIDDDYRDWYYQKTLNRAIRFYSSCNIGIIAIMPFIFNYLLKSDFVEAYNYIPILMTAALIHAISALYGSIYFAFKETKKVAVTTIIAAVINIMINLICIGKIGLYAAAVSSLIAYVVIWMIQHFDIQRFIKIDIEKEFIYKEIFVYILVFLSYYSRIKYIQLALLVVLIPYCYINNKDTIIGLMRGVRRKMGHNN